MLQQATVLHSDVTSPYLEYVGNSNPNLDLNS